MVSVSELYGAPETFRKIAMFFVKCFVETVRSVNKTFDWDVVREMLFEKLNWEEYCEIKTRIENDKCICRRSNPDEG